VLPLLAVAIWSRVWLGWWSMVPIVLCLVFLVVNPLLFAPPRSTRSWASKAVLGERVWTLRESVPIPDRYRGPIPGVTAAIQIVGPAVLGCGPRCSTSWPPWPG